MKVKERQCTRIIIISHRLYQPQSVQLGDLCMTQSISLQFNLLSLLHCRSLDALPTCPPEDDRQVGTCADSRSAAITSCPSSHQSVADVKTLHTRHDWHFLTPPCRLGRHLPPFPFCTVLNVLSLSAGCSALLCLPWFSDVYELNLGVRACVCVCVYDLTVNFWKYKLWFRFEMLWWLTDLWLHPASSALSYFWAAPGFRSSHC